VVAFGVVAGGGLPAAVRLGAGMLALQASIGAANDLADVPVDLGQKQGKPLPRGVVSRGEARLVGAMGLVVGLGLAAMSGPATAVVAAAGSGLGYLYDVRLSRTAWSWLPLAAALPLVLVYSWVGATGVLPGSIAVLVPVAVLAGSGLALANGLADIERDLAAGVVSAAVRLGRRRAWLVHALALVAAIAAAWWLAPRVSSQEMAITLVMAVATVVVGFGIALAASPWPGRRERAWELEAIGVAALGFAWVTGAIA
jgi:4-hydroxybenzoate polyprenyltransferase